MASRSLFGTEGYVSLGQFAAGVTENNGHPRMDREALLACCSNQSSRMRLDLSRKILGTVFSARGNGWQVVKRSNKRESESEESESIAALV